MSIRPRTIATAVASIFIAVGSSANALRVRGDGNDFVVAIWAPMRALIHGVDPFSGQHMIDGIDARHVAAPLYAPLLYVVHLPALVASQATARTASGFLAVVLLWIAVTLLLTPTTPAGWLGVALIGSITLSTMAMHNVIDLGQFTTWQLFGLALAIFATRTQRPWIAAVGIALAALKIQLALPLAVGLVLVGHRRLVARAAVVLAIGSVPGAIAAVVAAGGPIDLARSLADNYRIYNKLPFNDVASPASTRIDALAVLSRLSGPALGGLLWSLLLFVLAAALAAVALEPVRRGVVARPLEDARVWWIVLALAIVPLYHQPYDPLFAVVPIALLCRSWPELGRRTRWLLAGAGAALTVAELLGTLANQRRIVDALSVSSHSVETLFFVLPTMLLVGAAVMAAHCLRTETSPAAYGGGA